MNKNNVNNSDLENISSGAEKVEELANQKETEQENERAQKRIRTALEKQRIKQDKQTEKQKRRAETAKKRIAAHEMREAKIARRKSETLAEKERKHAEKLNKKNARERLSAAERKEKRIAMRAAKAEKRRAIKENDKRRNSQNRGKNREKNNIGGWITAVVSLSVIVFALGTMLTVGYFDMKNVKSALGTGYERSVYELMSFIDNIDTNLSKTKVASGRYERQRFLTNVVIDAELCEECIELFPIETEKTQNLTSFINRVSDYSRSLLNKIARGGKITEDDEAVIEYMSKTTSAIKEKLNETVTALDKKEIEDMLSGHSKVFDNGFNALENDVIEMPKMIYDGPFAKSKISSDIKYIKNMSEVAEDEAKEKLFYILQKYDVKEIVSAGETRIKNLELYNFEIEDRVGRKYSAQITKKGGIMAMFESFEECSDKNFNTDSCIEIAQNFLKRAGFYDMKEVWVSEGGTECTINFAYEKDGVIYYSDLIKVKVCFERGTVTGVEANAFIRSHEKRNLEDAKISLKSARLKLRDGFEVQTHKLCLIPIDNTETLAYEFSGEYDGNVYYVYIDAKTGEEVEIFTVVDSNQGRALM